MFRSSAIFILLISTFFAAVAQGDDASFEVPDTFNISDPLVGATLEHYEVSTDPTALTRFACVDLGSRCIFHRLNYDSVDFGSGQDTENTQGAVWAATKEGAILTLGPCTGDNNNNGVTATSRASDDDSNSCVVTCNANCTCGYITDDSTEPQRCESLESRAPTPSPKTPAPVAKVCPQQQFASEFCPTLMNQRNSLPDGTIDNYECFNFCGGVWIDTCDIATGTCGTTQCDNATATGTLNGVVKGCTREHYNPSQQEDDPSANNNNNNNDGTSSGGRTAFGSNTQMTLTMSMVVLGLSLLSMNSVS